VRQSSQGEVNIALNNSSASGNLIGTVGANFYFYSGGAERLRLDSAGNLGLGVTPSAWGSTSYKAIQGNYGTSYAFDQNVPTAHIVSNAYNNGTNWIYQINAPAARYIVNGWTSEHIWYTAPSGTAGNAISFTQAMTLDSSGNLMVGTTTSGGKLTVVSSTNPFVRIGNTSASDGGLKISYGFSDSHGLHLLYNPGSALAYIDNTYPISSGQVYGNIYFRQNVGGTMTTRMMIKADGGNVGIGTTSPTSMLTLNGTTPFIRIERSGVNTWQIQNNYLVNQNGFSINNISAGTTPFFIGENGNVGIGTSSPATKLEISQSTDNTDGPTLRISNNANTLSNGQLIGAIDFYNGDDSGTGNAVGSYIRSYMSDGVLPTSSQYLSFATGGNTERMRITSAGLVGIGTTNPLLNLQINSSSGNNSTLAYSVNNVLTWYARHNLRVLDIN